MNKTRKFLHAFHEIDTNIVYLFGMNFSRTSNYNRGYGFHSRYNHHWIYTKSNKIYNDLMLCLNRYFNINVDIEQSKININSNNINIPNFILSFIDMYNVPKSKCYIGGDYAKIDISNNTLLNGIDATIYKKIETFIDSNVNIYDDFVKCMQEFMNKYKSNNISWYHTYDLEEYEELDCLSCVLQSDKLNIREDNFWSFDHIRSHIENKEINRKVIKFIFSKLYCSTIRYIYNVDNIEWLKPISRDLVIYMNESKISDILNGK